MPNRRCGKNLQHEPRPYILTIGAAVDLQEIARYTEREWGKAQRQEYIREIEVAATELACGAGVFRQRDDLYPGVRAADRSSLHLLPASN